MDPEQPYQPPPPPVPPAPPLPPAYYYPPGWPPQQQTQMPGAFPQPPQPLPYYAPAMDLQGNAEVLAEIDRQQNKKSGWISGVLILFVSMSLFVGLGAAQWSWEFALLLVPILLFHEAGHYLAMRLFGYRNLRMFFIPLLGAAVSGRNYNVAGWKKVVVSLMGPVPGIFLGVVLGAIGTGFHHEMLVKISLITLLLNALNLLPVLPLDGGWVAHTIVFSRHWLADVLFRGIAAVALVIFGLLLHSRWTAAIGAFMLLGLPVAIRLALVVRDLRREGFAPVSPDNQTIPPYAAEVIASKLRGAMPSRVGTKVLAQQTLQVFEALNSRPPGILASFGFAAVHGGSFVLALIVAIVLSLRGQPNFLKLARAAVAVPQQRLADDSIRSWRFDTSTASTQPAERVTLVATFPKSSSAGTASADPQLALAGGAQGLRRFGQTLLLSLPADDQVARQRWISQLQAGGADVFVDSKIMRAGVRLYAIAPSEALAEKIEKEANEYFSTSTLHTIPPWQTPDARPPAERAAHRSARHTYLRLEQRVRDDKVAPDLELQAMYKQLNQAQRKGEAAEVKRLRAKLSARQAETRRTYLQSVRDSTTNPTDRQLAEEFIAMTADRDKRFSDPGKAADAVNQYKEEQHRLAVALGPLMGQLPLSNSEPAPGVNRFAAHGFLHREGQALQFEYLRFDNLFDGAPALVAWLRSQGLSDFRYEMKAEPESAGDEEDMFD